MVSALRDWMVCYYSDNELFLDTTGPFAGFLIPLFAWLARQESIRKGKAVRLGMERARAKGKAVGRPVVVNFVDKELVLRLRQEGKSWKEIAAAHPPIKLPLKGRKVKPSTGSIRRVFDGIRQQQSAVQEDSATH